MPKHLLIFGIWVFAALALAILHWPSAAIDTSAIVADASPASTPSTSTISDVERGKALFMAKGCATCHTHAAVTMNANQPSFGPNLTHYSPNPDFLQRWLREPQAVRPNTPMPNLNLKQDEIDALIAFLSANEQR